MSIVKKGRGRPQKPEEQKHTSAHALRMTPSEKEEFAAFAAKDSRSLSLFLILACHYFIENPPRGAGESKAPRRSRTTSEKCDKGHILMMTPEDHELFKDSASVLKMKLSPFIRAAAHHYIATHSVKKG